MLQDEYDLIDREIHNLKNKRKDLEGKLRYASNEDDEIEYKFQIMKINEQLPSLEEKHKILSEKIKKEREIKEQQEKEKLRKDKLYKKLYVTLDDNKLKEIKRDLNIYQSSKDGIIKELINKFSTEQEILQTINTPKVSNAELEKTVNYIESNYNIKFKKSDNNTLYFKKKLYSWSFENMDESCYIDAEEVYYNLMGELEDDDNVNKDINVDIIIIDELSHDEFVDKINEAKKYRQQTIEFERKMNNVNTYKKNVDRYEKLIAKKRGSK